MIEIIRCGHDSRHTKPVDVVHKGGIDHYLLLLIKTGGYVETDGIIQDVESGTAVLFDKNRRIHYGCREKDYNDDWIHFSVSPDDSVLSQSELAFGVPFQPPAFSDLAQYVRLLVKEKYISSPCGPAIQDSLMHALLLKLREQLQQTQENGPTANRYYPGFCRLREEILNVPGQAWDIRKMAGRLNMSVSYFQHLYTELFGVSCRKDIILARLSRNEMRIWKEYSAKKEVSCE